MKIGAGKSIKEPQKRSRIGSLINDLKYKIRSDKGKEFFINHLIPFLILLCLSIIIYRNIIGVEGEFINADLVRPPELDRFYELFTPMWRENESVTTMSRLPGLLFYLPFFGLGFLVNSGTSEVLVLIF